MDKRFKFDNKVSLTDVPSKFVSEVEMVDHECPRVHYIYSGQVEEYNGRPEGIGRIVFNNVIIEGQISGLRLHGWGRVISSSGTYYIGWQQQNHYNHGFGKLTNYDETTIQTGYWDDHEPIDEDDLTECQQQKYVDKLMWGPI